MKEIIKQIEAKRDEMQEEERRINEELKELKGKWDRDEEEDGDQDRMDELYSQSGDLEERIEKIRTLLEDAREV